MLGPAFALVRDPSAQKSEQFCGGLGGPETSLAEDWQERLGLENPLGRQRGEVGGTRAGLGSAPR